MQSIDSLINLSPEKESPTNQDRLEPTRSIKPTQSVTHSQRQRPSVAHQLLLAKVHQERQPVLVPPGASNRESPDRRTSQDRHLPENPTPMALIFAPVPVDSSLGVWWLQVVQPPSGGIATQRGYLRFVAQIADLTADFLKTYRLREHQYQTRINSATSGLLSLASTTKTSTPSAELLTSIISRVRDVLDCDQAFLIHRSRRNQSWRTIAASGMRSVNSQSDGSLAISKAADWFIGMSRHSQEPYSPASMLAEDRRPQKDNRDQEGTISIRFASSAITQKPQEEHLDSSGEEFSRASKPGDESILRFNAMFSSAITSWIPLFMDPPRHETGVGLMIYWSWPASRPSQEKLDQLLQHIQQVTSVVLQAARPVELAAWTGNSHSRNRNFSSRLYGLLKSRVAVSALTFCLLIGAGFIPVQSFLISPATIIAANQNRHYASSDATVRSVHVDYGQEVKAGQILLELEDRNLQQLFEQTEAEMRQIEQQILAINSRLLRDQQLPDSNRLVLEGELDTLRKLAPKTATRLNDLREQKEALKIRAVSDGVVTTWNASQILRDRPVKTGQLLISVQSNDSPWMIEARMPQHQSGRFLKLSEEQSTSDKPIEAQFSLASQPLRNIPAVYRPSEKGTIVALSGDSFHESIYRIRFAIPKINDTSISSGSAASLRIEAGRVPLWKALLGDALNGAWAKWRLWTGL
jgi:multidrug efflux pump subunit AcrA (membrane-fusion protein)